MIKNALIFLLFTLNILLCALFLTKNKAHRTEFDNINTNIINERWEVSRSIFKSFQFEDANLLISDSTSKFLNSILNDKELMVLRIHFPYCESCVYPVIENIEKYRRISNQQFLILTSFPSADYAEEFNDFMHDKSLIVKNISNQDFNFDEYDNSSAFLIVLKPDISYHKLFFPNQYNTYIMEEYTDNYFRNGKK